MRRNSEPVEVFRTSVRTQSDAEKLTRLIREKFPDYKINFDLDDCDNILRIEAANHRIEINKIEQLLMKEGYSCFSLQ